MKAVVKRNIWEDGKLIIRCGTTFDYNPRLVEQFITTEEGRGYYLAADDYLVDQENPLILIPPQATNTTRHNPESRRRRRERCFCLRSLSRR